MKTKAWVTLLVVGLVLTTTLYVQAVDPPGSVLITSINPTSGNKPLEVTVKGTFTVAQGHVFKDLTIYGVRNGQVVMELATFNTEPAGGKFEKKVTLDTAGSWKIKVRLRVENATQTTIFECEDYSGTITVTDRQGE